MKQNEPWNDHERFKELCALASRNFLSIREREVLNRHLGTCESCREIQKQYSILGEEGMACLLGNDGLTEEAKAWDDRPARERLLASVRGRGLRPVVPIQSALPSGARSVALLLSRKILAVAALAACALIALTVGAYRAGQQRQQEDAAASRPATSRPATLVSAPVVRPAARENSAMDLNAATSQIAHLEKLLTGAEEDVVRLRAASIAAEERADQLQSANDQKDSSLRQISAERDQLAGQLAEKEKAYEMLQTEYSTLRADHDRSLLHTASVETELKDQQALNQDQQGRLKDDEQYLTSDRDIRELMGARKLYIADVFDVDGASRTRKPFGRVFYTESKSLVFYAFDLDHQPGVKNASVFQVWGQRDSENNGATHPMNLGILYMDSETNRRWVLRSDDPKQLAEIDAVFVTVEPNGGSQKPTGKPLLYALLRKEANHP
jgi:hypothetical protein